MKTRKQAFIVSKIHWWRHQVSQVRAVEIIDLRISYQKGEPIAYIRPITTHGRHWLWDHVKYPYVGSNEIVDAEQLLALLQRMEADELTFTGSRYFTSSESPRFIEKLNPSAANG